MDFKHLFFSFEGRINRAKWWLGLLILMVVQWIVWIVLASVFGLSMMGSIDPNDPAAAEAAVKQMMAMMIPLGILMLVFIYPTLAIYAKRWHDRDKSGWWTLILFVPIVGAFWMLIECGILRGTEGSNRFGPDPLQE